MGPVNSALNFAVFENRYWHNAFISPTFMGLFVDSFTELKGGGLVVYEDLCPLFAEMPVSDSGKETRVMVAPTSSFNQGKVLCRTTYN